MVAAMVVMAAGMVLQGVGQIRQGQTAGAAAEYNAKVAEAQAKAITESAEFEAKTLEQQGEVEKAQLVREKAKVLATQRAGFAKAGVRIGEGSPLEVMADTAAQFELDLATSRYNIQTGQETLRYGRDVGVARSKSEAAFQRLLAPRYRTSGYISGAGSILTGVGSMMGGFAGAGGGAKYTGQTMQYGGKTYKVSTLPGFRP